MVLSSCWLGGGTSCVCVCDITGAFGYVFDSVVKTLRACCDKKPDCPAGICGACMHKLAEKTMHILSVMLRCNLILPPHMGLHNIEWFLFHTNTVYVSDTVERLNNSDGWWPFSRLAGIEQNNFFNFELN